MATMIAVESPRFEMRDKARKLPRQQRSRHLVEATLDATALVLARQGYDKLNTNLVATIAGVSIGSLYQYFPNKRALVAAVVERYCARLRARIVDGYGVNQPLDLAEAVGRIVASVVAAHRVDPRLHAVIEGEMPRFDLFDGHRATTDAIVTLINKLPARLGLALDDGGVMAHVVAEMVHSLIHAAFVPPVSTVLKPEGIERETVSAVLGYIAFRAR